MVEIRSLHSLLLMFGRTKRGGKFGNICFFVPTNRQDKCILQLLFDMNIFVPYTHILTLHLGIYTCNVYITYNIFALMGDIIWLHIIKWTISIITEWMGFLKFQVSRLIFLAMCLQSNKD